MAKYNFNDFIDRKSLDDGFSKLANDLKEIDLLIKNIGNSKGFSGADLKNYTEAEKELLKVEKEFLQVQKLKLDNEIKEQKLLEKKAKETEKVTAEEKKRLQQQEKAIAKEKELASAMKLQAKSIEDLERKNRAMVTVRKQLDLSLASNRQKYNELTLEIAKNQRALNDYNKAIGRHQGDVGKYGLALQNLKNNFVNLGAAIGLTGGIAGAIQIFRNGITDIMQFDKAISNLSAITGTTGKDLDFLRSKAVELSKGSSMAAADIVESFKFIASANSELGESPSALAKVTEQAILLSEASGDDLQTSASNLLQAMNKMGVGAGEAAKTVDIFAASAKFGSAEIPQATEALLAFGGTMKLVAKDSNSANDNVREANALIQVLAKNGKNGAEAGTALRNVLLKLAAAEVLPKAAKKELADAGVNVSILTDKSLSLSDKLKELSKIQDNANALTKVFGTENLESGKIILSNISLFDEYNKKFDQNGIAAEQARTNLDNLSGDVKKLQNSWTNFTLSLEDGTGKFSKVSRGIVQFTTDIINSISSGNSFTRAVEDWYTSIVKLFQPLVKIAETFGLITEKGNAVETMFNVLTGIFYATTAPLRVFIWILTKLAEGFTWLITKGYEFITSFEAVGKIFEFVSRPIIDFINLIKSALYYIGVLEAETNKLAKSKGKLKAKQADVNKELKQENETLGKTNAKTKEAIKYTDKWYDSLEKLNEASKWWIENQKEIQLGDPISKIDNNADKTVLKLKNIMNQYSKLWAEQDRKSFWDRLFGVEDGEGKRIRDVIIDQFGEVSNATFDFMQNNLAMQSQAAQAEIQIQQEKQSEIDRLLQAEIDKNEENVRKGVAASDTKINQLKKEKAEAAKLEQKALNEQKKIARQQKAIATSQAIINTALAITKVYATNDPITASIIAAALGIKLGLEVATIQKQKFAKGGAGILEGESHENGGIGFDGNKEAEGGEAFGILNKKATRKHFKHFKEVVNLMNSDKFDTELYKNYDIPVFSIVNNAENRKLDITNGLLTKLVKTAENSIMYD